jgi:hypothetical protein
MTKKSAIIFSLLFLVIIYAVPLIQSAVEQIKDKRIQVLELFEDIVSTPVTRAMRVHSLSSVLLSKISNISSVTIKKCSDSSMCDELEDILYDLNINCMELKTAAGTINRYVSTDENSEEIKLIKAFEKNVSRLMSMVKEQKSIDTLETLLNKLRGEAQVINTEFPELKHGAKISVIIRTMVFMFWDSKYIRPFEKKIENASVFAIEARSVMAMAKYLIFNDLGEKALSGHNGWLFYRPDIQYLYKPYIASQKNYANQYSNVVDPELLKTNEEPIAKIVQFKEQLARKNIDLLVVVVPGKASIYPELLYGKHVTTFTSPSKRFIGELKEMGVETVDLFDAFIKEKQNDSLENEYLYLAKDTHWKARGAWCAAKTVADKIKKYSWFSTGEKQYVIDTLIIPRIGDVAVMSTLNNFKIRKLSCVFEPESTRCFQVSDVTYDETGEIVEKKLYKDDYKNSQILLLGDSFSRIYQTDEPRSAGWISHLAYQLGQPLATIVNDGGASTIVREILARKNYLLKNKKLVVWEFVERDIRYGERGWKYIDVFAENKVD